MPSEHPYERAQRNAFLVWLSANATPGTASELPALMDELETYCIHREMIQESLFSIKQKNDVQQLRIRLESDIRFKLQHLGKSIRMLSSLDYYSQFLDALAIENDAVKKVAEERFTKYLRAHGKSDAEVATMLLALRGVDDIITQCDSIGAPLLRTTKSAHAIHTFNMLPVEFRFKRLLKAKRDQYAEAAQHYIAC